MRISQSEVGLRLFPRSWGFTDFQPFVCR